MTLKSLDVAIILVTTFVTLVTFVERPLNAAKKVQSSETPRASLDIQDREATEDSSPMPSPISGADENFVEPMPNHLWLQLSGDVFHQNIPGSENGIRPRLAFDAFLNLTNSQIDRPWSLGGVISTYALPHMSSVRRYDLSLRAGYWFSDHRYGIHAFAGKTSTNVSGYDDARGEGYHYGLEARVRFPLSDRFDIFLGLAWARYQKSEITRHVTSSGDIFCSLFTLGLADGCNARQGLLTVPASHMGFATLGVGYLF